MSQLELFSFPGACSQVTITALEQAKASYTRRLVNIAAGDQTKDDYKKVVPTKKVPALLVDGTLLLENSAILIFIARTFPEARIFPRATTPMDEAQQVSALSFCSGNLHPVTRSIFAPQRLTDGDVEGVRRKGMELAATAYGFAEKRFKENGWWFGAESILDVYVNWAFTTALKGGLPRQDYPQLAALHERLLARPAYTRMLEIEAADRNELGL